MPCPLYAQRGNRCTCEAVRGNPAPTLYERESYCHTSLHQTCPTLVARIRKGRALSEPEYFAVWTGESEGVQQQLEPAS
jgi:hypothetical protein